jgi:hypothetical protein
VLVEFQRPLGDRTQFGIYERALVDVGADRDGLEVLGDLQFMHLVGERWLFSLYATHRREIFDDDFVLSSWDAGAGGVISWFLEDFLRLDLSVDQSWAGRDLEDELLFLGPDPSTREQRNNLNARLGIVFGRGRLAAPGLIQPQLPLH